MYIVINDKDSLYFKFISLQIMIDNLSQLRILKWWLFWIILLQRLLKSPCFPIFGKIFIVVLYVCFIISPHSIYWPRHNNILLKKNKQISHQIHLSTLMMTQFTIYVAMLIAETSNLTFNIGWVNGIERLYSAI